MKAKTKIVECIGGIVVMALGIGLVAIDYFIVKAMMGVGTWGVK
jgi:hypothetical protein